MGCRDFHPFFFPGVGHIVLPVVLFFSPDTPFQTQSVMKEFTGLGRNFERNRSLKNELEQIHIYICICPRKSPLAGWDTSCRVLGRARLLDWDREPGGKRGAGGGGAAVSSLCLPTVVSSRRLYRPCSGSQPSVSFQLSLASHRPPSLFVHHFLSQSGLFFLTRSEAARR